MAAGKQDGHVGGNVWRPETAAFCLREYPANRGGTPGYAPRRRILPDYTKYPAKRAAPKVRFARRRVLPDEMGRKGGCVCGRTGRV